MITKTEADGTSPAVDELRRDVADRDCRSGSQVPGALQAGRRQAGFVLARSVPTPMVELPEGGTLKVSWVRLPVVRGRSWPSTAKVTTTSSRPPTSSIWATPAPTTSRSRSSRTSPPSSRKRDAPLNVVQQTEGRHCPPLGFILRMRFSDRQ